LIINSAESNVDTQDPHISRASVEDLRMNFSFSAAAAAADFSRVFKSPDKISRRRRGEETIPALRPPPLCEPLRKLCVSAVKMPVCLEHSIAGEHLL
jgi:hypothetical protein